MPAARRPISFSSSGRGPVAGITGTPAATASARRDLAAQLAHDIAGRADEVQSGFGAGIGKFRIFGQKTITGMDGVGAGFKGDADGFTHIQIGFDRSLAGADQIAFIGLEAVQRKAVLARIDVHRADPQFIGRAHNADSDFASVGDQQFMDFLHRYIIFQGGIGFARNY